MDLKELYATPDKIIVTAHRGDSLHFPENTIPAFLAAAEAGADLIEFDLRASRDKIPVVIHDRKVDRISSGSGPVGDYSLKELKQLDFLPAGEAQKIRIPTFKEVLKTLPDTIGLNIQVKETEDVLLEKICSLFDCYQLYRRAYLTLSTFADAELVRQINSRIELCVLERKRPLDLVLLKEMKIFGCKFLQPHRRDVTPELCLQIDELGFYANMYFSDTVEDHHHFITAGVRGIITDDPALLVQTLKNMERYTGSAG